MTEISESAEPRSLPPGTSLDLIGTTLRQAYCDAAAEPLPDAFEELLRQLR